jgi:hypothetical protein
MIHPIQHLGDANCRLIRTTMSRRYFEEFPPELILLLPPLLATASLNALVSTGHRLHEVLQPELESRLTPEMGRELLLWAALYSEVRAWSV